MVMSRGSRKEPSQSPGCDELGHGMMLEAIFIYLTGTTVSGPLQGHCIGILSLGPTDGTSTLELSPNGKTIATLRHCSVWLMAISGSTYTD